MVPFLGQRALNKRSNPTINVVVYFHTEQTTTTENSQKTRNEVTKSPKGVGHKRFLLSLQYPSHDESGQDDSLRKETKTRKFIEIIGCKISNVRHNFEPALICGALCR